MNGAQVTMIALYASSLMLNLAKNGEPRTGNYSFGVSIVAAAISAGILWWGGFWQAGCGS